MKPDQRVFVGVIAPIDPRVETPEEVRDRVLEAAEYIPVEQLGTTRRLRVLAVLRRHVDEPRHGVREDPGARARHRARGGNARRRLMAANDDEEELLRSVALQNAQSILLARQRAEEELVRAKEALERKTQELARSLAMMRATLESTTDGILVTDARGQVTDFNRDTWTCGGCRARSWRRGSTSRSSSTRAVSSRSASRSSPGSTRSTRRASGREPRRAGARGRTGVRAVLQHPVRRRQERRPRLELSRHHRDSPRGGRAQAAPRERAVRARRGRAGEPTKDEFLATLSHELRTPLSAILGWAHILRSRRMSEAELEEGLKVIERNARMQTQLIEDLLDMSRIISGKLRLDVQPVEPATFIEAALETVRPAAEAKGIPLSKLLDPAAGPVMGDPNRLQQIVWNLLSNAIKFTPKDGRVQVLLERVSSHVEITVADTGIGIKPEFLPHVFDRFRQADSSTTRTAGPRPRALDRQAPGRAARRHGARHEPGGGTGRDVLRSDPAHGRSQEDGARRAHPPQGHRRQHHRLQAVGPFGRDRAGGRRSGGRARSDPAGARTSATRGSSRPARPPRHSGRSKPNGPTSW